jgi:hypothetical protein
VVWVQGAQGGIRGDAHGEDVTVTGRTVVRTLPETVGNNANVEQRMRQRRGRAVVTDCASSWTVASVLALALALAPFAAALVLAMVAAAVAVLALAMVTAVLVRLIGLRSNLSGRS